MTEQNHPIFKATSLPNQYQPKAPTDRRSFRIYSLNKSPRLAFTSAVCGSKSTTKHKPTHIYRWCMHHAPPTLCSTYIHHPIECCGASYRRFWQQRREVVAIRTDYPPLSRLWRWWQPLHLLELLGATKNNVYTTILKNVPKMIQQSKWFGGGSNTRKSSGGWEVYLHAEVNMLRGGQSWHLTSPQQSTINTVLYSCWGGIIEGNVTIKIELGLMWCMKNRVMWKLNPNKLALFLYPSKLGGIGCNIDKINVLTAYRIILSNEWTFSFVNGFCSSSLPISCIMAIVFIFNKISSIERGIRPSAGKP